MHKVVLYCQRQKCNFNTSLKAQGVIQQLQTMAVCAGLTHSLFSTALQATESSLGDLPDLCVQLRPADQPNQLQVLNPSASGLRHIEVTLTAVFLQYLCICLTCVFKELCSPYQYNFII